MDRHDAGDLTHVAHVQCELLVGNTKQQHTHDLLFGRIEGSRDARGGVAQILLAKGPVKQAKDRAAIQSIVGPRQLDQCRRFRFILFLIVITPITSSSISGNDMQYFAR